MNMTLEQVRDLLRARESSLVHPQECKTMADAIDAHLAAQVEWPSEKDVEMVCAKIFNGWPDVFAPNHIRMDVRAALQSVRPPVGVVSNAEVAAARDAYTDALNATGGTPIKAIRAALESYASRHAPTKD